MKKKIFSIIIAGIMLISIVLAVIPTIDAAVPHSVKGVLYIDGEGIAPAGIEIQLEFNDGTETTTTYEYDIYSDSTNYNLPFFGHDSPLVQPGYFTVIYQGSELIPIDNDSITITEGQEGYIMDLTIINFPPNAPTLVAPSDGATGRPLNPALSVSVSDPEGDTMSVTFYDASDDSVIGIRTGVASGSTSTITWSGLEYSTTYSWYAIATDAFGSSPQSSTWSFTTEGEPIPPNQPPTASFNYTPSNPINIDIIQFTDTSTDPDGIIVSWWWEFGDGYYSSLQDPVHCYYSDGSYDVYLTVTDDDGATDTFTVSIVVTSPPEEVEELIEDIEAMDLHHGLEKSLTQKLMNVIQSHGIGLINTAINQLNAFINQVEAQSGKKLTEEQADYLVAEAQAIIDSL